MPVVKSGITAILLVMMAKKRLKIKTDDNCMAFELRVDAIISMIPDEVRQMSVKEFEEKYQGRVDMFEKNAVEHALAKSSNRGNINGETHGKGHASAHGSKSETRRTDVSKNISKTGAIDGTSIMGTTHAALLSGASITLPLDEDGTMLEMPLTAQESALNLKALSKDRREALSQMVREAQKNLSQMLLQLENGGE
ncbi:hypothetical protein HDU96_006074 [Phlyctochytrium bullatum]|nr:hypothetical protein HDU96_006074 [Phlyctochytrium bullatum]